MYSNNSLTITSIESNYIPYFLANNSLIVFLPLNEKPIRLPLNGTYGILVSNFS